MLGSGTPRILTLLWADQGTWMKRRGRHPSRQVGCPSLLHVRGCLAHKRKTDAPTRSQRHLLILLLCDLTAGYSESGCWGAYCVCKNFPRSRSKEIFWGHLLSDPPFKGTSKAI